MHGVSVCPTIYFTFPCINVISNDVRGEYIYHFWSIQLIHKVIPQLTYSATVTDYFGNLTSCLVNIILECGNNVSELVQLTGDTQSLLSTSNFTTNLYLTSNVEHHDYYSIKLWFLCVDTNAEVYANVNLTTCSLGYVFKHLKNLNQSKGHVNV